MVSPLDKCLALVDSLQIGGDQSDMKVIYSNIEAALNILKDQYPSKKEECDKLKSEFAAFLKKPINEDGKKVLKEKIRQIAQLTITTGSSGRSNIIEMLPSGLTGSLAQFLGLEGVQGARATSKGVKGDLDLNEYAQQFDDFFTDTEKAIISPKERILIGEEILRDEHLLTEEERALSPLERRQAIEIKKDELLLAFNFDLRTGSHSPELTSFGYFEREDSSRSDAEKVILFKQRLEDPNSAIRRGLQQLTRATLSQPFTFLPPYMKFMTNLVELNLQGPQLRAIPPSLLNLSKLEILDLAYNKIKDLPNLTALVELRRLNLRGNRLTSLPDSIWTMSNLQVLDISYNSKLANIVPSKENFDNIIKLLEKREKPLTIIVTQKFLSPESKAFLEQLQKLKNITIKNDERWLT